MRKRRIGIFGGSFNPIHNGHVHLCHSYLDSGLIDELWVIPVYDPPHKSLSELLPFKHRLEMTRLAFIREHRIKVLDVENHLPQPNYTLNTLEYLKSEYPECDFYLCIGGDSLNQFHTWYQYQSILKLTKLLVAKREHFDVHDVSSEVLDRTTFISTKLTPESSTSIRQQLSQTHFTSDLPKEVMTYIQNHRLFL